MLNFMNLKLITFFIFAESIILDLFNIEIIDSMTLFKIYNKYLGDHFLYPIKF